MQEKTNMDKNLAHLENLVEIAVDEIKKQEPRNAKIKALTEVLTDVLTEVGALNVSHETNEESDEINLDNLDNLDESLDNDLDKAESISRPYPGAI